jgi:hypothetical protein
VLVSDLGDSGTEEFDVEPDAEPSIATTSGIDLDEIQRDLEGVQTALERLNEGTYRQHRWLTPLNWAAPMPQIH